MPLESINNLVFNELPFLINDTGTVAKIESVKTKMFYDYFVIQLSKDENALANETNFSFDERLFLAEITAHTLLKRRILENKEGVSGETTTQPIKKAKADVVEVEYGEATNLQLETEKILFDLEAKICLRASRLNLVVPFCIYPMSEVVTYKIYE